MCWGFWVSVYFLNAFYVLNKSAASSSMAITPLLPVTSAIRAHAAIKNLQFSLRSGKLFSLILTKTWNWNVSFSVLIPVVSSSFVLRWWFPNFYSLGWRAFDLKSCGDYRRQIFSLYSHYFVSEALWTEGFTKFTTGTIIVQLQRIEKMKSSSTDFDWVKKADCLFL